MTGSRKERARSIRLTEEEALALLEICLYSDTADDPVKAVAMRKVADVYRGFMRSQTSDSEEDRRPMVLRSLNRGILRRRSADACA